MFQTQFADVRSVCGRFFGSGVGGGVGLGADAVGVGNSVDVNTTDRDALKKVTDEI